MGSRASDATMTQGANELKDCRRVRRIEFERAMRAKRVFVDDVEVGR